MHNSTITTLRSVLMLVWAVFLTGLTGILGVAPFKVVRRQMGALPFWLLGVGISLLFWSLKQPSLAIVTLVFIVLVASHIQAEEMGFGLFKSAFFGLVAAVFSLVSLSYLWISRLGPDWQALLKGKLSENLALLGQSSDMLLLQKLSAEDIFSQIPSVVICLLVIATAVGMMLERPLSRWVGLKLPKKGQRLVNFRLHEAFIWPVIISLLFGFVDLGYPALKIVAMNFLNVAAVCYFFQGLAVLCKYFVIFKVGTFWRAVFVFLFTTQLFLVLSAIGFVDFWVDFRVFFNKRAAEMKKKGSVR